VLPDNKHESNVTLVVVVMLPWCAQRGIVGFKRPSKL
jgi:hypothetical protein